MTIWHIAWNDLRQRRVRSLCVMLGLTVGIALVTAVLLLLDTMKTQMAESLNSYGPTLVISGGSSEVTFSYGGITLEGVTVGARRLAEDDLQRLQALPEGTMIKSLVPKLFGTANTYGQDVIIAGTDIHSEFAAKPWLRLVDYLARYYQAKAASAAPGGMGGAPLALDRQDPAKLTLAPREVILGAGVAYNLGLFPTNRLTIQDQEYKVKAVLEKNGTAEDGYIYMALADAQAILGQDKALSQIELTLDPTLGREEILLEQIRTALPEAAISGQTKSRADREEVLDGLGLFGSAVSGFVLLAAGLAASIAMTASVMERTREIGLFGAVGLGRPFIGGIILLEGTVLSLSGGILGYLAGNLTARLVMPLLDVSAKLSGWRIDYLAAALGLSLAIGTLASIYPASRAARLDPAEALRFG